METASSPVIKEAVALAAAGGSGPPLAARSPDQGQDNLLASGISTVTNITKQRIKLNMKLLGVQLGSSPTDASSALAQGAERPSCREQFVAPEMSIVTKLMAKPVLEPGPVAQVDYDSSAESECGGADDTYLEDEDDDPFSIVVPKVRMLNKSNL